MDSATGFRGVPVIDRRIELEARIATLMRSFGNLTQQIPRFIGLDGLPGAHLRVDQLPSASTARMNSSDTRTELFAFWKKIEL